MTINEKPFFLTDERFPATIAADRVLSHLWHELTAILGEGCPFTEITAKALMALVHEHAPVNAHSDAMLAGNPWCSGCKSDVDSGMWSDCRTITTLCVMLGVPLPLSFTHYGDIVKATNS